MELVLGRILRSLPRFQSPGLQIVSRMNSTFMINLDYTAQLTLA